MNGMMGHVSLQTMVKRILQASNRGNVMMVLVTLVTEILFASFSDNYQIVLIYQLVKIVN